MFLYVLDHLGAFRPERSVRDTPSVTHIFGGGISRLDEKKHHQEGECSPEYSWPACLAFEGKPLEPDHEEVHIKREQREYIPQSLPAGPKDEEKRGENEKNHVKVVFPPDRPKPLYGERHSQEIKHHPYRLVRTEILDREHRRIIDIPGYLPRRHPGYEIFIEAIAVAAWQRLVYNEIQQ